MKKAFTLVELLGVIVIIALIALVAFPPMVTKIKELQGKVNSSTSQLIYTATELYLDENRNTYGFYNNDVYCVKLQTLVEDGKLKKPLNYSNGKELDYNKKVKVKVITNKDVTYSLEDACTEINQKPTIPTE